MHIRLGYPNWLAGCALAFLSVSMPGVSRGVDAALTVELVGAPKEIATRLESAMAIAQLANGREVETREFRLLHRRSIKQLAAGLRSFGYYRARIDASLDQAAGTWTARYRVDAGEVLRYQLIEASVVGDGYDQAPIQQALGELRALQGRPVNHARYETLKRNVLRQAVSLGYLNAQLQKHEVRVDLDDYSAALRLVLDTGPRHRFGEIRFYQDMLEPSLVARFNTLRAGAPYRTHALFELEQALYGSDYFDAVIVTPRDDLIQDHRVPIDVTLRPRKRSRYLAGLGFYTDTGTQARVGYERRLVNRRGHRFGTELKISGIGENFQAQYRIPVRNPRTDELSLLAEYRNDDPSEGRSEVNRLGANLSTHWRAMRVEVSLTLQHEDFEIGEDHGSVDLLVPSVSATMVRADDRIDTRRGFKIQAQLRGAVHGARSDLGFTQFLAQGKLIHPLGARGRVSWRGEVGTTQVGEFNRLPVSFRFFAGGDQSVRGYRYRGLGPKDASKETIGGRHLLVASVEYEHRLRQDWAWAIFLDVGNAFNDDDANLEQGAGFGVRWKSPVGPVRIDLANGFSDPDRPWRLHIGVGPDL